jgi:ATP-dependent RNA helicase RhlE
MTFDQFNFHPAISAAIAEQGYRIPTPIQEKAMPSIMTGRDLLGLAQTGTGKTAAFALPLIQQLINGPRRRTQVLILAPTRELAAQIHESICALSRGTGLRSVAIFGGVNINPQIAALKRGTEFVVACPGRLLDHISHKTIDLTALKTLVIDEADRMFDMGFLPDIRRIVKTLPKQRQTLLFSATMPDDIRHLASEMLNNAVTVQISHTKPIDTVSHAIYPVEQHLKPTLLKELLKRTDTESVLVFTRTKHRAKSVSQQLDRAGFKATCLQGNLSQNQRDHAIEGFRNGSYQILVATDIAARGIDVSAISHVINFDMPDTADAYTHRIGRTGRASKTGEAFTFVTHEDKSMVCTIERVLGEKLERKTVPGFDYSKPKESSTQTHQPKPKLHSSRPANYPTHSRRSNGDRHASQQRANAR